MSSAFTMESLADGELYKRGRGVNTGIHSWHRRTFILADQYLVYYDKNGLLKGKFNLTNCSISIITKEEAGDPKAIYAFMIYNKDLIHSIKKELILCANSEMIRKQWIDQLDKQIEKVSDYHKFYTKSFELIIGSAKVYKKSFLGSKTLYYLILTSHPSNCRIIIIDYLVGELKYEKEFKISNKPIFTKIDKTKFKFVIANEEWILIDDENGSDFWEKAVERLGDPLIETETNPISRLSIANNISKPTDVIESNKSTNDEAINEPSSNETSNKVIEKDIKTISKVNRRGSLHIEDNNADNNATVELSTNENDIDIDEINASVIDLPVIDVEVQLPVMEALSFTETEANYEENEPIVTYSEENVTNENTKDENVTVNNHDNQYFTSDNENLSLQRPLRDDEKSVGSPGSLQHNASLSPKDRFKAVKFDTDISKPKVEKRKTIVVKKLVRRATGLPSKDKNNQSLIEDEEEQEG